MGVELTCALALSLGELAQQVFVCPAKHVQLGVAQAQAVPRDDLDQRGEAVLVQRALPRLALVEVLDADDAVEDGIEPRCLAHGVGDELAERAIGRVIANRGPGIPGGDVEAHDGLAAVLERVLVVGLDDGVCGLFVAELLDVGGELVVEDV